MTAYRSADATVSAHSGATLTPSDSTELAVTRGLYIGGAGDVKVDMAVQGTVTFVGVLAGSLLPIQVKRVYATGTTATNIVSLY